MDDSVEDARNYSENDKAPARLPAQRIASALTAITNNMTDTDIDRVIEDAREADKELYIKDTNGTVFQCFKNTTYGGEEDNEKIT